MLTNVVCHMYVGLLSKNTSGSCALVHTSEPVTPVRLSVHMERDQTLCFILKTKKGEQRRKWRAQKRELTDVLETNSARGVVKVHAADLQRV